MLNKKIVLWLGLICLSANLNAQLKIGYILSERIRSEYEEFKEAESQLQLEYKKVQFELSERDLSFWSVDTKSWQVEPAEYIFEVGASSGDIRESASVWLG